MVFVPACWGNLFFSGLEVVDKETTIANAHLLFVPELHTDGYQDPTGAIDPVVYDAAQKLWPVAQAYALEKLGDAEAGYDLMIRAVAAVSRRYVEAPEAIENLRGYLYRTYTRLVQAEREIRQTHQERHSFIDAGEEQAFNAAAPGYRTMRSRINRDFDNQVMLRQVLQRVNTEMRVMLNLHVAGHSFDEIAKFLGRPKEALKKRFYRSIDKLRSQFGGTGK